MVISLLWAVGTQFLFVLISFMWPLFLAIGGVGLLISLIYLLISYFFSNIYSANNPNGVVVPVNNVDNSVHNVNIVNSSTSAPDRIPSVTASGE